MIDIEVELTAYHQVPDNPPPPKKKKKKNTTGLQIPIPTKYTTMCHRTQIQKQNLLLLLFWLIVVVVCWLWVIQYNESNCTGVFRVPTLSTQHATTSSSAGERCFGKLPLNSFFGRPALTLREKFVLSSSLLTHFLEVLLWLWGNEILLGSLLTDSYEGLLWPASAEAGRGRCSLSSSSPGTSRQQVSMFRIICLYCAFFGKHDSNDQFCKVLDEVSPSWGDFLRSLCPAVEILGGQFVGQVKSLFFFLQNKSFFFFWYGAGKSWGRSFAHTFHYNQL